ncbi:MAG: leucyl aminopeptidase family protein [Sphingomonas sp.]|uniref:leucyl aminopeptidase family protein n=1 Tax=Sphingomonas sp. TaxID=28214 RepID=UPI00181C8D69|nr:leucyl aminopeptidase family protein [Sphingomonas sp.]MBA3667031.1 leucyl aminopeptidase family protein [Sphingomonas sp.]
MTDFAALLIPDRDEPARAIHLVDKASFEGWAKLQPAERRALLKATHFDGTNAYQFALLPAAKGEFEVVTTVADAAALSPWCLAKLGADLPEGRYRLAQGNPGPAVLGWLLAQHRFDRYKSSPRPDRGQRVLLTKEAAEINASVRLAEATAMVRDLVDTPAADMGPAELEEVSRALASEFGAKVEVTGGDTLAQGYPMIAAVGQGAARDRAPRLIELRWGKEGDPRLAIVGKGVCFDTGGLDIKPASGMRLMKKDMGGAAHALALGRLVMAAKLPVRLHMLIPAVENSVSANAFRPGDIIDSRKGLKVEIDNTDAEGRLVLGDALTRAGEEQPALIVDFATLTGAARVALGPDLPAMFVNDDELADELERSAKEVADPVWRMPLWDGYDEMLKSDLADLANAADSPMGGAITAALFLRRFVPEGVPWAHFDTFAWRPAARPGRPKGGEAIGLRVVFAAVSARFGA